MNSDSKHSPPADHKSSYSEDTVPITAKQESYQVTLINSRPPKQLCADWKAHLLPPSTSSSEPGPLRALQHRGSQCPAALGKASPASRGRASAGMWLTAGPCGRRVTGHRGTLTPVCHCLGHRDCSRLVGTQGTQGLSHALRWGWQQECPRAHRTAGCLQTISPPFTKLYRNLPAQKCWLFFGFG